MNGRYLYVTFAALIGVITIHFPLSLLFMMGYIYLLFRYKRFTVKQLNFVILVYCLFLLTAIHDEMKNKTTFTTSSSSFFLQFNELRKIDGDLLQITATEYKHNEKIMVRYKIKTEAEKEKLKDINFYGRVCRVKGELIQPSIAKNPNAFDYRTYLAVNNIYWILETTDSPIIHCTLLKSTPLSQIKELRFKGIRLLEEHFPPQMASLSAALLFGDRSLFDPDILAAYQKTGIVHLLAISGLHVSLLIGMVYYIGLRIGFTREIMLNFLLLFLPIYAVLSGASPSVIRAVMMAYLVLLTLKWNTRLKLLPVDTISIAFIIYVFMAPRIIYNAGFQLSFAVCFAIILSGPKILQNCNNLISQMIVISVVSQLAALPILLYHFFEISFISIIANLLYIPLFTLIFLPGLYIVFFVQFFFGFTPHFVIDIFMKFICLANELISQLANISIIRFSPGRPNWFFLLIYVVLIFLMFLIWEAKFHKKYLIFIGILLFLLHPLWNRLNPFGEVTMIDVGQGDSILIHLPYNKGTYLIDTGGTMQFPIEDWKKRAKPYEVGRDVVVPYLKGKGITEIDKLILTHGDMDHIGGASSVIQELKVKQILLPAVVDEPSAEEMKIIQQARIKGIPIIKVAEGRKWKSGQNLFYILGPEKNFQGERNAGSIVLFADIGGLKWFFGGDVDASGEEIIIKKFPKLQIDVLKAGHHGSNTSSSTILVDSLNPSVSWISAGEGNRYGHPHDEVMKRLQNTVIYRTDQQGAVTYLFWGDKGTFSAFLP